LFTAKKNELPWLVPRKGFSLDISGLKDVIDSTFGVSFVILVTVLVILLN
jgi:hypothetical protein